MGRALLNANAAGGALAVIRHRYAVHHGDALFGAGLYADFALDTAGLAGFKDIRLDYIAVGAQHDGALFLSRHHNEQFLRTFLSAHPAAGAVVVIHMRQAIFAHRKRVKFADIDAVAKALASPGASLDASGGKLRRPAGLNPDILALGHCHILCPLAKQY